MDGLLAEGSDVDFKESVETKKPKSWLKTVSAFANTDGGRIVFGVADDSHEVVGVEDPQKSVEAITALVRDRIDPLPHMSVAAEERELGRVVIVLSVISDVNTPHYYRGDGVREAYVRVGDQSVPAPQHILNELVLKGTGQTYDSMPSRFTKDDASFTVLRAKYKFVTGHEFKDSDFVSFGLVTRDGRLTNAGALLADEPLVRHSRVFCTRWDGRHKDDALDDAEFSGSLLMLLQNGEDFVKKHNRVAWTKAPRTRVEYPSYVERAVTEALVNALIHRDYLMLGSEVHVDIYDDRLAISSPGGMFDNGRLPADPANDEMESKRRNPVLADLFQRMNYMERRGSGLRKICRLTAHQANYEPRFAPRFEAESATFRVTLWDMNYREDEGKQRFNPPVKPPVDTANTQADDSTGQAAPPVVPPVTPQVAQVVALVGGGEKGMKDFMQELGLNDRKYVRLNFIRPALDAGLIERTIPDKPNSRLQKYRLTDKGREVLGK